MAVRCMAAGAGVWTLPVKDAHAGCWYDAGEFFGGVFQE